MENYSNAKRYFPHRYVDTHTTSQIITESQSPSSSAEGSLYHHFSTDLITTNNPQIDTTIDRVSQWFLSMSAMSNKKLQKLCYYAYCWFIVFFNDIEQITRNNVHDIRILYPEPFQAWIHGPVSPRLYHRYKDYGWRDIPKNSTKPNFPPELESLLQQVWDAYGSFSADQLEAISHTESPWKNARAGLSSGDACSAEISNYDILQYYSNLR